jgi:zinc/manganese transport system substrate-binding protein
MLNMLVPVFIVVSLAVSACQPRLPAANPGRLNVISTFSIVGDMVAAVGGDSINHTVLVGPGLDTHAFSPRPADAMAVSRAKLILEIGLDYEGWLDDLYEASDSRATRVELWQGIDLLTADSHGEDDHSDDAHDGADDHAGDGDAGDQLHGANDPHIWHNVENAMIMVRNIRDALVQADPDNANAYRANADAYLAELHLLDEWVVERVSELASERRVLVTTHDSFSYFAQRYGFQVVGAVLPTSTEGASPSAQQMAALVRDIRAAGVPAVFAETVSSNALLNQVAAEAGVSVVATLYTDALGPPGSVADSYVNMMRQNVNAIVAALRS